MNACLVKRGRFKTRAWKRAVEWSMCDAIRDWGKKKMKNTGREKIHLSQWYMAIQEVVYYLIHAILECDQALFNFWFTSISNFFNKLTWKAKTPEIIQLLTACFFLLNSDSFTKYGRFESFDIDDQSSHSHLHARVLRRPADIVYSTLRSKPFPDFQCWLLRLEIACNDNISHV